MVALGGPLESELYGDFTHLLVGDIVPTSFPRVPHSANRQRGGCPHQYMTKSLTPAGNLLILFDSRFLSTVDTPPAP